MWRLSRLVSIRATCDCSAEAAVRELVARRVPLYRFVMSNVLKQHDLDRADGRLAALRSAAPLVASIRDNALVSGYARELAGQLGMDVEEVRREVMHAAKRSSRRAAMEAHRQRLGRRPTWTLSAYRACRCSCLIRTIDCSLPSGRPPSC